jgi:signal transduction histidine kinase/CheY-like chemotaxis protein
MGTGPTGDVRARLAALAEPSRLLVEIFTNVPNPLQIYARSGHTVLVNNAFIEMMGGEPPEEYNVFEDETLVERGVAGLIRRGFAGERISVPIHWYDIRETRNLPPGTDTSGGRRVAISAEMIPLLDDKGEVSHVLVAFHDHTAEIEAREDAARASRNAERARFAAEVRTTHQSFLAMAAGLLSSSLDLEVTLRLVAQLATESFADFCIIDLVNTDGSFRRVATLHRDAHKQPLLNELQEKYPPHPGSPQPAARVMASGQAELLPRIDEESLEAHTVSREHHDLLLRLGLRSHISFPLRVGDRVVGAISLGYTETGRYTEDDLPLVQALASHAAVAIENARLFNAAEQARREAEMANRAKDEFLAMLGHELRNPLAPIVTALEISRERQGASSERKVIERQVDNLRRLVDDLLDVSRITRGALELTSTPLELADAVHDGVELARPLLAQRHHELTIDMASNLPVHGDRLRLAQVVSNLLINAARYTEPGGRIAIVGTRVGDEVVLRVRDTGVGMSAELLPHVFDTFMRGSRPIDRATGGLGLGLAIVRAITEQHGGRVAARSDGPGRGSELEVTLPALDANVARQRTPTELPPPRSGVRGRGFVLVVDDNADAAQLIGDALEMHGFNVVVAMHPHAALVLADKHNPVVALIDLGLPDMDGYELANRLRAADAKIQCVALTGFGAPSDRERTTAAGFVSHLVKPIKMPALIPLLEQLLSQLPDR